MLVAAVAAVVAAAAVGEGRRVDEEGDAVGVVVEGGVDSSKENVLVSNVDAAHEELSGWPRSIDCGGSYEGSTNA